MDEQERKAAYWAKKRARQERSARRREFDELREKDPEAAAAAMFNIQGLPQLMLMASLSSGREKKRLEKMARDLGGSGPRN